MPSISFFLFQQARVVVRCMFTRRLVHLYRSLSGMTTQHRDQAAGKNAVATVKRLNQRSSVNDNGSSEENPRRAASLRAFDRDLDSSESIPSDHSSLYDAARASSELEEDACYDGGPRREVRVEQAADIPLAVLPAPAPTTVSHSKWPVNTLATIVEQRSTSTLHYSRSLSHLSGNGSQPTEPSQSSLATSPRLASPRRRRARSLDDMDSSVGGQSWLGNDLSPVSPTQPTHPPPVRTPTPPGLPSFGTDEALYCASRFALPSPAQGGQHQGQHHAPTAEDARRGTYDNNGIGTGNYGGALRRLFGLPSPTEPRSVRLPLHAIGRAEDGTAIRGRFPYRQSGHGVDLARRLDGHPFHRRSLPVAQPITASGGPSSDKSRRVEREGSDGAMESRPTESAQTRIDRPSPAPRSSLLYPDGLPSYPKPVVTAGPRRDATSVTALPAVPLCDRHRNLFPQLHETGSASGVNRIRDRSGSRSTGVDGNMSMPLPSSSQPSSLAVLRGSGELEAITDEETPTNSWTKFWKACSSVFCCCVAGEDDAASGLQSGDSQDTYRTARSGSADNSEELEDRAGSAGIGASPHQHVSGSEDSQVRRRPSRPWRPAYGFYYPY